MFLKAYLKGNYKKHMADTNDQMLVKADAFFSQARKSAETNNFDYAIDMYLEGLRCAPDSVIEGHVRLRELGILRQSKGGKKPSMMEKMKFARGKTPLEQMINAEYLFAKEPDNFSYAENMLKAAIAGNCKETAKWIADLLFQANNASSKPSLQTYLLLKDSYATLGLFDRALAACQFAVRLKPSDAELASEFQRLSAELTVSRGKYDQTGDFRKSIKNREVQEKLQSQESVVKTEDYRQTAIEDARKRLAEDRNLPKNIYGMVDALVDLQDDNADNEAIELLEDTYSTKQDFSFKQKAGEIKIKQIKRKLRQAKSLLESKPSDPAAKTKLAEVSAQLTRAELEHWKLCVENYPTDLQAKYEYGNCLIQNRQYDEAIPYFQESQRDPRHKTPSMSKIGLCFFRKGWFTDSIDIFNQAIDSYEIKDDSIAKELRYNLARSYEEEGNKEKALEIYRKIAQLDFAYKDVRQRVDKLRAKENQ
jgi:tetratricopeptide (TPR) repeat protein